MKLHEYLALENDDPGSAPLLWWLSRVAPPFLLLPAAFVPLDIGSAFLHGGVAIAGLVSVFSLVDTLAKRGLGWRRKTRRLVRPVITIGVMVIVFLLLGTSRQQATETAYALAAEAQRSCNANEVCPSEPAGFSCADGICGAEAGFTATYSIRYRHSAGQKEFTVTLRYDIDHDLTLTGGVKRELTRKGRQ